EADLVMREHFDAGTIRRIARGVEKIFDRRTGAGLPVRTRRKVWLLVPAVEHEVRREQPPVGQLERPALARFAVKGARMVVVGEVAGVGVEARVVPVRL